MAHPRWQAGPVPYVCEEFMEFKTDELFAAGALLLGRKTYEGFAKAWPGMKDPVGFADHMNNLPKYVVSSTLEHAEWNNSHVIKADGIAALKEQDKDVLVFGSSVLLRTLMEKNLVDEYRLLVYPVVLGEGKHLFQDGVSAKLKLVESRAFSSGVVLLRYEPTR
jgi:dihydrofolate reductase